VSHSIVSYMVHPIITINSVVLWAVTPQQHYQYRVNFCVCFFTLRKMMMVIDTSEFV
jgi:hypothetical protein